MIMKKSILLAAAAAVVLASCAKIETSEPVVPEQTPIDFAAYSGNALTKAGTTGEMTTTTLQTTGFGVFAYQTTGTAAFAEPNFIYHTNLSTTSWTYTPVKYWPNQIQAGNTDSQPATAEQADKVSFFAYAPRVAATAATGAVTDATYGITALTSNATTGDPKVSFTVSNDLTKQVDLLWGVVNPEADQTWSTVAGTSITLAAGKPYIGLQKPALNTKIHFYFRHALAQLKLQAQAAYNQAAAGGTAQNGVKITIESVVLTVKGISQTADLNLNNTTANTPLWENQAAGSDMTITVDGTNINSALKDGGKVAAASQPAGVTGTAADVIADSKYYMVIPKTGSTTVNVKVTYYVTTDDADLKDGFSRVKNVISKDVAFSGGLAAGTKNSIKMTLGISEVKFEAEVTPWVDGSTAEVDLPLNS